MIDAAFQGKDDQGAVFEYEVNRMDDKKPLNELGLGIRVAGEYTRTLGVVADRLLAMRQRLGAAIAPADPDPAVRAYLRVKDAVIQAAAHTFTREKITEQEMKSLIEKTGDNDPDSLTELVRESLVEWAREKGLT